MTTGEIMSVTIPKTDSKYVIITVRIPRTESDSQYCFYFSGDRYDQVFVRREIYEAHPELYVVKSACQVRFSKSDDGRYFTNISF